VTPPPTWWKTDGGALHQRGESARDRDLIVLLGAVFLQAVFNEAIGIVRAGCRTFCLIWITVEVGDGLLRIARHPSTRWKSGKAAVARARQSGTHTCGRGYRLPKLH